MLLHELVEGEPGIDRHILFQDRRAGIGARWFRELSPWAFAEKMVQDH
jgi:hypothetical protein